MKEGTQIGKFIIFFVLTLFLNYFLGIFFSEFIQFLLKLYNSFIGSRGTYLAIELSMFYLYMGYILIYTLFSGFILSFFLGVHRRVLNIHTAFTLLSLVVFIGLFFWSGVSQAIMAKYILALPFISLGTLIAYSVINGVEYLFSGQGETSSGSISGFFGLSDMNPAMSNMGEARERKGFFATLFEDIKNSFNKGIEEDRQNELAENLQNPQGSNPYNPLNNDFQENPFTDKDDSFIESFDLEAMMEESKLSGEEIIAEEKEAEAIEQFEKMTEKDFRKEWKQVVKDLSDREGLDEKELDIEEIDLNDYSGINNERNPGVINLRSFIRQGDSEMDSHSSGQGEYVGEGSGGATLSKEEILSGGLSSLIKATNTGTNTVNIEKEVEKEKSILDNLENSYFIGFTDDQSGVSQLERLYKEL